MKRLLNPAGSLVLGLFLGMPNILDVAAAPEAHAADSTDRRVMAASDVSTEDAKRAMLDEAAHQARLESITRLKELIQQTQPEGDQAAEMYLRLADLYFEEGRFLYLGEMLIQASAQEKCFNTPGCNVESIGADNTKSREWQEKSIKLYQRILQNYPQYVRADEATFYLGQALSDTGKAPEANTQFANLVRTYPESKWVPDSYVMIGEYWFEKNEAYKALTAYQRAAQYRDSDKYAFANYKLAWCFYNVQDYQKAIDTMKSVVLYSMSEGSTTTDSTAKKKNIQLQDEALKDLVRFFADAGEIEEAIAWFEKLGKKDLIRDVLKRLAATYVEQGKFENAIQTYRRLIGEDPQGAGAPGYQNEIIQAYTKMGKKQETIDEIERLLKTYGKSSSWAKANASNQTAVKEAEDFIEKNLRTVATNYHNEAKKLRTGSQAAQAYSLAEQAYRTYLQEFPDSKYSYDVRYSFSELLYTVKNYGEAYEQYMKVVAIDPKGQHSEFCASSAIFAAEEMIKKENKASGGGGPGSRTEPLPLSEWEQKQLTALDQYAKLFPSDKKTKNIIYKSAYLLYGKNQFKEASDRFRTVIGMDPASKEAEQAANLILDSFTLTQDWTNLKDVSKAFYDQKGLGGSEFKQEVYGIYENASLKLIEIDYGKTQDKAKAATNYWAFYQEFPQSKNADLALNNASVYYNQLARTGDAIKVRLEIINKFPKSKYYEDQMASLGFDYESIGDFSESANWYEKLYARNPKHAGSADAIYSAALFREAGGQWEQGIKNYLAYITTYPEKPNLNGLNLQVARIYEDHQKWPEAAKVYLAFFTKPPAGATINEIYFSRLHYGLLMDEIGLGAKQMAFWKETVAAYEKTKATGADMGSTNEYIAQILYILAEPQLQAYLAMKIDGPKDKKLAQKAENKLLGEQLVAKAKALAAVEQTYTVIVGTGAGEWGLASLTRLGEAYENMSQTLLTSYVPGYLTADQKELYTMALEDKAYPAQEKATNFYSKALEKAYELSLYNDNAALATRRLGVLRPDDFPGLFETIPTERFTSPSVEAPKPETEP